MLHRKTKETDITCHLNLDGSGKAEIDTGIGFFDHMLDGFTRHGFFDLNMKVKGDLIVDCHHSIEDAGIVLGNAISKAVGDKKGIKRYGSIDTSYGRNTCSVCNRFIGKDHISALTMNLQHLMSVIWTLKWFANFLCNIIFSRNEPSYQSIVRLK